VSATASEVESSSRGMDAVQRSVHLVVCSGVVLVAIQLVLVGHAGAAVLSGAPVSLAVVMFSGIARIIDERENILGSNPTPGLSRVTPSAPIGTTTAKFRKG
jgi:hypothetical protein